MSRLHKFEPRKGVIDVKRTAPLARSMEEFFEDFPPRRWMETFEPIGWKWPIGIDYERAFRLDVVDRDKELVVRAELPGVEKDDVKVEITGDRLAAKLRSHRSDLPIILCTGFRERVDQELVADLDLGAVRHWLDRFRDLVRDGTIRYLRFQLTSRD
mgnify:CR=1 FL=1